MLENKVILQKYGAGTSVFLDARRRDTLSGPEFGRRNYTLFLHGAPE